MNKILLKYISEFIAEAEKKGLKLIDEREINYGVQLKFSSGNDEIPVNVYNSVKKGINPVVGGSPTSKLRPIIQQILNQEVETTASDHKWKIWAGTDESGKGDFFGPLVVCGFICKTAMIPSLQKLGVRDSKQIKDKEIAKIAKQLFAKFMPQIETISLMPSKYNELYEKFRSQNKKLNELLAWMHARVILNLKVKHKFEGAVVDKFASDKTLKTSLKEIQQIELLHKFKGEDDLAVAAASIIARYLFIWNMEEMEKKYEMDFPKGASGKVKKSAEQFAKIHGKGRLQEVAKIHFKTYNELNL
ncbi:MAG: ribonuclease HIII [Candidatus Cloacimonetes bacterium]|nr:ribonuclease HIII [Candidatus Cloacimonadota bacterium]MCF7812958.1 ribonuclease HIII [Candidatus Cloacimonadota bacterium]MCF7867310.1 ribonuclease HIII [Candidatus Cloacimonadota bacterium]MCF7882754.1 ribonuclease HIII [Candidatus Cloacimonadota bacterium]